MIAVTGASGFLGRHVVERAGKLGKVRALSRSEVPGAEHVPLDLLSAPDEALGDFLKGARTLVHLAGMVSRRARDNEQMTGLHVDCTRRLLLAAEKSGIEKVILASTSGTVGIFEHESYADDESPYAMELASEFGYYRSKIYQEKLALEWSRKSGIPLLALRPSLLLGPGDDRLSSTADVARFLSRKVPAIPSGGISFVDVRDTADAFIQACRMDRRDARTYLLTAENWTMQKFFAELERESGVSAPGLHASKRMLSLSSAAAKLFGEPRFLPDAESLRMSSLYWYVNADRAKKELDFSPRSAAETLRDTISYIRSHNLAV